jgi:cysteine desulfurase/selenocysteine lyase
MMAGPGNLDNQSPATGGALQAAPAVTSNLALSSVRDRFPILSRTVHGKPLVYLDTAATAQKPDSVIAAEADYYRRINANVHRGMHALADAATTAYEECRARVAHWLGTAQPENVVITRSATSALNLIAHGWEHHLQPGDEVLLTEMEHHANLVPWLMLAKRRGIRVRYLPLTATGELDLDALPELLGARTKVFAFTAVSNVLGTINPVAELVAAAREVGALTVVDAAQAVGHLPVSFDACGADLLVFSAHKSYGPMGLGFLVGRPEILADLQPLEGGGEMIDTVDWQTVTWAEVPHRFEAGTPNVAAAASYPAAIDLLSTVGLAQIRTHEQDLVGYAWQKLAALDGLQLYGPPDPARRGGLISFHHDTVHSHDMAQVLDELGVAVRAGHHCAQPLHRRLGVVATTRASFGLYSNQDDVDRLVDGINFARKVFAQ